MSLESNIAALVAASTGLTQAVNITKVTVETTRDSAIAKEAPVTAAKDAVLASTTAATTDAATTVTKLAAVAADYVAQKTTKGLAAVQTSADTELKDRLHRRDPARHPFRGARPSLVMDFVRRECHRNNAAGNLEPVDLNTFMTFTRGSTATYVGPDGLIKEAAINTSRYGYDPVTGEALGLLVEEQRTNLFPYSAYPASDSAAQGWNRTNCDVYPNVAVAPDGTMTAAKAVVSVGAATTGNDGVGVFATPGVTSSATHSLTLYVKNAGAGYLRVRESITTGQIAKVNLTTGAITAEAGYTTATFTVTATDVGNGWWRVAVVRTPTTTFGFNLKPGINVGDGVSGIYIWGAQLEAGAFPTSYIPTPATFTGRASTAIYLDANGVLQTAANGVARSDAYGYDSDGVLRPIGLLLENASTNLITYSSDFANAAWLKATLTSYSGTLYTESDPGSHMKRQADVGVTQGNVYTGWFVVSKGNCDWVRMMLSSDYSMTKQCKTWFNLSTGAIGTTSSDVDAPTLIYHDIRQLGAGTWLISITVTASASATLNMGICTALTNGSTVRADVGSGAGIGSTINILRSQLEPGSYATSYIPTTTAQVTRAADTSTSAQVTRARDLCAVTGNNFVLWHNGDAGTLMAHGHVDSNANASSGLSKTMASIQNLSAKDYIRLGGGAATASWVVVNDAQVAAHAGSGFAPTPQKIGLSLSKGSSLMSRSGGVVDVKPLSVLPKSLNLLYIGCSAAANGIFGGYIKQLTYFPRQLSDADLQALTILED